MDHWKINGKHYSKTLEAWLRRTDENKPKVEAIMKVILWPEIKVQNNK